MTSEAPPPAPPPIHPAGAQPAPGPVPVYPMPPAAYEMPRRRQQDRGLDGLLIVAWVLSVLGAAGAVVGAGIAVGEFAAAELRATEPNVLPAGLIAAVGTLVLIAGLSAGSIRSIVLRRNLGEDRYRGPSPVLLLVIWQAVATLAVIPFLGDVLAGLEGEGTPSTALFITIVTAPVTLFVVTVLFVLVPRALPGVRLVERSIGAAAWNFFLGVLVGAPAWVVGTVISLIVTAILAGGIGLTPDSVLPLDLLEAIDPILLVFALVVAAPVAEELFFRAVLFTAWEREYGYRRALIGSSVLFAAIHLSLFALAPILVLAFVLGYVYSKTRSLLTVIGIHATFNAISTALLLTEIG